MSAKKYFTAEEKKEALRRYAREAYHRNRASKLAAQKIWRDSEEGRLYRSAYQEVWREENYDRVLELNRASRKRTRAAKREYYNALQRAARVRRPDMEKNAKQRARERDPVLWRYKVLLAQIHRYGLTLNEWADLMTRGCSLCGTKEQLCVDHCHKTGRVRGILCTMHNTALGKFGDDPHMLRRAAAWVGGGVGWQNATEEVA